jgi:hypothetical protein
MPELKHEFTSALNSVTVVDVAIKKSKLIASDKIYDFVLYDVAATAIIASWSTRSELFIENLDVVMRKDKV